MREFMVRHCGVRAPPAQLSFAELSSPTESAASSAGESGGSFFPLTSMSSLTEIAAEAEGEWEDA